MWKTFETFGNRFDFQRLGRAHSSVWLERVPDKDEVHGSSPCAPIVKKSFGRLSKLFFFALNGALLLKRRFRTVEKGKRAVGLR